MVIAKLSRPSSLEKDHTLVLFCSPLMISDILKELKPSEVLAVEVEFVNVVMPDE